MPFESEKQRRWMWWAHPDAAEKWAHDKETDEGDWKSLATKSLLWASQIQVDARHMKGLRPIRKAIPLDIGYTLEQTFGDPTKVQDINQAAMQMADAFPEVQPDDWLDYLITWTGAAMENAIKGLAKGDDMDTTFHLLAMVDQHLQSAQSDLVQCAQSVASTNLDSGDGLATLAMELADTIKGLGDEESRLFGLLEGYLTGVVPGYDTVKAVSKSQQDANTVKALMVEWARKAQWVTHEGNMIASPIVAATTAIRPDVARLLMCAQWKMKRAGLAAKAITEMFATANK